MSNPENFIDEVTEEVRRDRLFQYMRRYGWIAVLLIIGLVAAAAWFEWTRSQHRESAQDFGDALTRAMQAQTPDARLAALEGVEANENGLRRALVDLTASGQAIEAGDRAAGLARLETIANDASLPQAWRDLARLRRATIAGKDMSVADRRAAFDALAVPGAPFRALALEQSALLSVEEGDREAALGALRALMQEPDLTPGLRQRATQLIVALGGQPDAS